MFRSSNEKIEVKRVDETVDIVKRIGVITADRVHLTNYPRDNPVVIFNPASYIEDETLKIYGRIVLGYFTYASAIIELTAPVEELSDVSVGHYSGRIVVKPDNKFDILIVGVGGQGVLLASEIISFNSDSLGSTTLHVHLIFTILNIILIKYHF